ncbi:MAG: hypothetical protein NVSMB51_04540 [Solirubrobacteraceae bacterium]
MPLREAAVDAGRGLRGARAVASGTTKPYLDMRHARVDTLGIQHTHDRAPRRCRAYAPRRRTPLSPRLGFGRGGCWRGLCGHRGRRRWNRRSFDGTWRHGGRVIAADRALELAQPAAERLAELRQPPRTEEQDDDEHEDRDVEWITETHNTYYGWAPPLDHLKVA